MKITTLTLGDLRSRLDDRDFFAGPMLPITEHRALSQVNNPRAEQGDTLLFIAYEGHRVIGFLGILPDRYFGKDGERRFGWISGWWIEPDAVKTGVGAILLMKALAQWKGRLAVAGFTESARRVFEGCGRFLPVIEDDGIILDLRIDPDVLRRRLPLLERLGPMARLISGAVGLAQDLRCAHWRRFGRRSCEYQVRRKDRIDQPIAAFLDVHGRDEVLWRSADEVEWMMEKPWVVSRPGGAVEGRNYPFSAYARSFEVHGLEVRDASGGIRTFLVATVRDGEIKLPIAVFDDSEAEKVADVMVDFMIEVGAYRMTTYHPGLVREFSGARWPVLMKRPARRLFVFSKKLDDVDFSELVFQDGEGDGGFT